MSRGLRNALVGVAVILGVGVLVITAGERDEGCSVDGVLACLPPPPCAAAGTVDHNPKDRPIPPAGDSRLIPQLSGGHLPFGFNDAAVQVGQVNLADDLELHRAVGSTLIRVPLDWGVVEGSVAEYDFSEPDEVYCAAVENDVRPVFHLTGVPTWAADPGLGTCSTTPCVVPPSSEHYASLRRFAELAAIRYPEVAAFEIWNEPNFAIFWPHPDPARYTEVLREAFIGVKNGNPRTPVLGGALSNNQADNPVRGDLAMTTFLDGMAESGAGAYMDGLSIHAYPTAPLTDPDQVFDDSLAQAETADMPSPWPSRLWVTETGIPTPPGASFSPGVPQEEQLTTTEAIYDRLEHDSQVDAVLFHTLIDPTAEIPGGFGWGWVTDPAAGLMPKPVYCEFALRFGDPPESCSTA